MLVTCRYDLYCLQEMTSGKAGRGLKLTSMHVKGRGRGPLVTLQDGDDDRRDGEDGTDYPYDGSDIEGHRRRVRRVGMKTDGIGVASRLRGRKRRAL